MQSRDVDVFEGGNFVQTWPCTPTKLPDGRDAVIWRGIIYPLLPENRIDASQPWNPGRSGPATKAAVLKSPNGCWVLVQGPERSLLDVCQLLSSKGANILRTGRWLGELDSANVFDWYACCDSNLPADAISAALGCINATVISAPDLFNEVRSAEAATAEIAESPSPHAADPTSGEPAAYGAPEPTCLQFAPVAIADDAVLSDAMADVARLSEEVERLRARPIPAAAAKLHQELTDALSALRPDVRLARDSWIVVAAEFRDRSPFWRAVNDLPRDGGRPDGWKAFRSAERWWERHLSTGQDDTGRAYARFDPVGRAWDLLVSWKADQGTDKAWLQKQR